MHNFFSPPKNWQFMGPPYFPYFGDAFLLPWVWRDSIKGETLRERKGEQRSFAAPQPRAAGGAKARAVVELSMMLSIFLAPLFLSMVSLDAPPISAAISPPTTRVTNSKHDGC